MSGESEIDDRYTNYTGSGYVKNIKDSGSTKSSITWTVNNMAADRDDAWQGGSRIAFRYSFGSVAEGEYGPSYKVYLNGAVWIEEIVFFGTGCWSCWDTTDRTFNIRLAAGTNIIKLESTVSS